MPHDTDRGINKQKSETSPNTVGVTASDGSACQV